MKQTIKRISLAFAAILAALLLVFGGMSLVRAHAEEAAPETAKTYEGGYYTLVYDEAAPSVNLLIDANITDYSTSTDVKGLASTLKSVFTDLFVKGIMRSPLPDAPVRSASRRIALPDGFDINGLTKEDIKDYIDKHLSDPEELKKYLDGEYDILIQQAADVYQSSGGSYEEFREEVNSRLEAAVNEVFPPEEQEEMKNQLVQKTDELVQEVVDNGGAPAIGIGDIIDRLTGVTVDGIAVYRGDEENKNILTEGVKTLLKQLPRPAEIVDYTPEQLEHLFDYTIGIDTTYGNFTFDVTFGLKGDATSLMEAVRFVDRYVDVTRTDGVPTAVVRVPRAAANYLLRFIRTAQLSDETKDTLLSLLGEKKLGDHTFAEVKAVFDELLDFAADPANDHYLYDLLEGHEYLLKVARKAINKMKNDADFYNKCMEKAEILFGEIPAKIGNKCALDFYRGDGQFVVSGSVGVEQIIDRAITVLESLDIDRLAEYDFASYFDIAKEYFNFDRTVSLRVDLSVEGLYKITYLDEEGNSAREMLLPAGAEIAQFGGEMEEGSYWFDSADTAEVPAKVELMPEKDITVGIYREQKQVIDLSSATWKGPAARFEYDGKDHRSEVELQGVSAVDAALIHYVWTKDEVPMSEEDKADEVGKYTVTVEPKDDDHEVTGVEPFTFEITKIQVDLSAYRWKGTADVTFDKQDHFGKVVLDGVPADLTKYFGYVWTKGTEEVNEALDAGTYTISVQPQGEAVDTAHYEVKLPTQAQLRILKYEIDVRDYNVWQSDGQGTFAAKIVYDGAEHSVTLKAVPDPAKDGPAAEDIEVTYTGERYTEAGKYTAVATFSLKEGVKADNFDFTNGNTLSLGWSIDEAGGGGISGDTDYIFNLNEDVYIFNPYNTELNGKTATITPIAESEFPAMEKSLNAVLIGKRGTLGAAYDITFTLGGTQVHDVGLLSVWIRIPDGMEGRELTVAHYSEDGSVQILPIGNGSRNGHNYLIFQTNTFSAFGIAALKDIKAASLWWMWLLIAIIIVLLVVTLALLLVLLKKKNAQEENEPTEEAEEEAVAEVSSEEQPVEEEPVEEAPAEEEPVEENPAEEAPVEEAPVEEPPVEEGNEKPEIPAIIAVESKEENMKTPEANNVVYDRSFTARISQADETVRDFYHEIKTELVSFRGIKSRLSWSADSFNKGRTKLAKLQIKGKTLVLYLALDPEQVASKYHTQSVAEVSKYAQVPTKLRVRNPRSLKYAKELIAQLMEKEQIAKSARFHTVAEIPVQTTEELVAAGLIKCKTTARPTFWGKSGD